MITIPIKKISIRNRIIIGAVFCCIVAILIIFFSSSSGDQVKESKVEITPVTGDILISISSTGTIQPENRLEVKPPVAGRLIKILVKEGDKVKEGEVLAWMSSTERAAILDAAKAKGESEFDYWEDTYKPTPLISPISGEVIVSTDQPGQTVTANEAILVLSDKLIVKAQVDETDIGRVHKGQSAIIGLDAYPEVKVRGVVDRISYESTIVNNVTTYLVYILPETIPDVFRSGMSANVEIIQDERTNVLTVPVEAVKSEGEEHYVTLVKKNGFGNKETKQKIETGLSDERNVEVLSGLKPDDKIVMLVKKVQKGNGKQGGNPFMPMPGGKNK